MRLKSFTAPDMNAAMQLVRQELGENAIIVSSRQGENGEGVRLTAAIEQPDDGVAFDSASSAIDDARRRDTPFDDAESFVDHLMTLLSEQGVPERLAGRLVMSAKNLGHEGATMALAAALDEVFRFAPLKLPPAKPLILIGANGAGKTTIAAKLVARAHMNGSRFKIISTDTVRAGAIEQLACFTRILKAELAVAGELGSLVREIESAQGYDLVVIDTPGTNPRSEGEILSLAEMVEAIDAEPLLVMAAGNDPAESAEMAAAFSIVRPQRLVATRLDTVKRLGGILAAAEAGRLRYSDVSVSASVASDIKPVNPVSLARMLICDNAGKADGAPIADSLMAEGLKR